MTDCRAVIRGRRHVPRGRVPRRHRRGRYLANDDDVLLAEAEPKVLIYFLINIVRVCV